MASLELCQECNQPTGRAGAAEDSLYLGSIGPFCEDCYEEWPEDMNILVRHLKSELTAAKAEIERLQGQYQGLLAEKNFIGRKGLRALFLRKQAEAVESEARDWQELYIKGVTGKYDAGFVADELMETGKRLRTQAQAAEKESS